MTQPSFEHTSGEADTFIRETGSLPTIEAASLGLLDAIEQTRHEISISAFSPTKFPAELSPHEAQRVKVCGASDGNLSFLMSAAIEENGFAGAKRHELDTKLATLEIAIFKAIQDLVELRTDLVVAQQDV
jgi:hypothetical protein